MEKTDIEHLDGLRLLYKPGSTAPRALLLVCSNGEGGANVMPFGSWFISAAEPSGWYFSFYVFSGRHSRRLLLNTGQFTVNLPRDGMDEIVKYCGSVSGRDHDKAQECGLTLARARHVEAPIIKECCLHLECQTRTTRSSVITFPGQDKEDVPATVFQARILALYGDAHLSGGHSGTGPDGPRPGSKG
jgi:flavin reductase (DIM6/NTAB) family NADH-FMN oxidoreductase RutF